MRVLLVFSASAIHLAPAAPTAFFWILYATAVFYSTFKSTVMMEKQGERRAHFRITSLRLHWSTSARAWAPASSMPLLCKLARPPELDTIIGGEWIKERNDAHLSDTRAWFIFRASARNFAPLEPMLLFRRLNHKYLVIKQNLDGAAVEMMTISVINMR